MYRSFYTNKTYSLVSAGFFYKSFCAAVFIETVDYYVRKDGYECGCLLDASRAFNKVHHAKLFKLLPVFGMPEIIVMLLLVSYTRQKLCIS